MTTQAISTSLPVTRARCCPSCPASRPVASIRCAGWAPIDTTKSITGHGLAAAGAVVVATSALCWQRL